MRAALCVLLALLPAAWASSSALLSSPLLLWSNQDIFSNGLKQHVSYQVLEGAEEVASGLLLKALGKAAEGGHGPLGELVKDAVAVAESHAVVVFVGTQLDVADMRSRANSMDKLDSLLGGAVSSLVVPYALSQGASMMESVCGKLDAAGVQHKTINCAAPSSDLRADVAAALSPGAGAGSAAAARVLVVCGRVEEALVGTNAGLAAEVEQLRAVQAAVDEAGVGHVFVYASQAQPAPLPADGRMRSLMQSNTSGGSFSGFGDYTTCGPLCKTQVRWLEGMLAVLFLALASCAGLVCLYVLDTPTRFEAPKEGALGQS